MVERYKQPGLPSPVVGTPGPNRAAGAAAGEAAKLGEQMVNEQFAAARNIGESGGKFDQALQQGAYYVGHAAIQAGQQMQSRQAGIALAKKESDVNSTFSGLSTQLHQEYAGDSENPLQPNQVTDTSKDVYERQFQGYVEEANKSKNPYYKEGLIKLAGQYRDHYTNSETAWIGQRTLANLSGITATAGIQTAKEVQGIPGAIPTGAPAPDGSQAFSRVPLGTQVAQLQTKKAGMNRIYNETAQQSEEMGKQFPTIAEHGVKVREAQTQANYAVNKTFFDKLISQPPDKPDEALDYMNNVKNLAQNAVKQGLEVKDPEALNRAIDTGIRSAETDSIAINHADFEKRKISMLDDKNALNEAIYAGDEDAAGKILQTHQENTAQLQGRIEQWENLPEGRVKTGLLQDAYALKSMAVNMTGQEMRGQVAIIKAQRGLENQMARQATAAEKKLALDTHNQNKLDFDDTLQGFREEADEIFNKFPIGPEQSNAMADLTDKAVAAIDKARGDHLFGNYGSDRAKRLTDEFQGLLNKTDYVSGLSIKVGNFQIGAPYHLATTPQERLQQVTNNRAHLGKVQELQQLNDGYLKTVRSYIDSSLGDSPVKTEAKLLAASDFGTWLDSRRKVINPKTGKNYTEDELQSSFKNAATIYLEKAQKIVEQESNLPRILIKQPSTAAVPSKTTSEKDVASLNPIPESEIKKGVHQLTPKEAKALGISTIPPPPDTSKNSSMVSEGAL